MTRVRERQAGVVGIALVVFMIFGHALPRLVVAWVGLGLMCLVVWLLTRNDPE